MKIMNDATKDVDERWSIHPREPFWLVFWLRNEQVLGWFRTREAAIRFARLKATRHGYEEYVVLEATHSFRQASQPVPEVDVFLFGEVKQ